MNRRTLPRESSDEPEFQIAPMIDILLVLLVFFMAISSTEVLQANDDIRLPVAKDAQDRGNTRGQAVINVLWNPVNHSGSFEIDQKTYATPAEIVPLLKAKLEANSEMRVLIRADKAVRYEFLKPLLREIGAAHVENVTFSVIDHAP